MFFVKIKSARVLYQTLQIILKEVHYDKYSLSVFYRSLIRRTNSQVKQVSGKDISRVSCELLQQRCFSANVSAGDEVSEVSLDEFDGNLLLSSSLFTHNNDAERSLSDNFR